MSGTTNVLDSLRNVALSQLVGCEQPLVDMHIRWTVMDFLARSRLLRESFTVTTLANQADYVLMPATTDGIIAVLAGVFDGTEPLAKGNVVGLPAATGRPFLAGLVDARTLRVYPTPVAGATPVLAAHASVTISPDLTAPLVVPYVCQPWFDVLSAGVLARLYGLPDKPWTSLTLTGMHEVRYRQGVSRARHGATTGRAAGAQAWRFNRFGR